jgi:hypothetical protein
MIFTPFSPRMKAAPKKNEGNKDDEEYEKNGNNRWLYTWAS